MTGLRTLYLISRHSSAPYANVILVVLCFTTYVASQRYPQNGIQQRIAPVPVYPNSLDYIDNYDYTSGSQVQRQNNRGWLNNQQSQPTFNVYAALQKLKYSPKWVPTWPKYSVNIGQVSAVSLAPNGQVFVFHRASRTWGLNTFTNDNRYWNSEELPIRESTIAVFNSSSAELVDQWGENLFYMPHGLTVDKLNNVWITDVALHQVMKFSAVDKKSPVLTLGVKFTPGNDDFHFCKPSAVAVMDSGEFFVSDGYCNTRIIKFSKEGHKISQWGRSNLHGQSPQGTPGKYSFFVPHSLALAEDKSLIYVADRENGRVTCFNIHNGTFVSQFRSSLIGSRLFAVAYIPIEGGRLYVINGPEISTHPVRGFVINITSGKVISQFGPNNKDFANPHDIAVSPNGREVFVVELDPYKVHKFEDLSLPDNIPIDANEPTTDIIVTPKKLSYQAKSTESNSVLKPSSVTKPTATVEGVQPVFSGDWNAWMGVAGGVAGGLGAVLICLIGAAALLARARRRGNYDANLTQRLMDETP